MVDEKKIQHDMKALDLTREEVLAMYADDNEIDHDKDLFPLTAEQKKVEKAMRQADRKKTAYNFTKRERKPNELKREIIDDLFTFICENWPEVGKTADISNIERQIDFCFGDESFSLQLIQHRKPKN